MRLLRPSYSLNSQHNLFFSLHVSIRSTDNVHIYAKEINEIVNSFRSERFSEINNSAQRSTATLAVVTTTETDINDIILYY